MMLKLSILMLASMSIILSLIPTPLTLGMFMLVMTMLSTLVTTLMTSTWIAMAIFLVYVGGLLVLFAYFLAIQPNQLTNIASFLLLSMSTFLIMFMITKTFHSTTMAQFNLNTLSMPYMMFNTNLPLVILLGVALLLILIVVVKITYTKAGPLRPFI